MGLADDHCAILTTLSSHQMARDDHDAAWMAKLWAEDAVLERVGWPEDMRLEGRDRIVPFFVTPQHGADPTTDKIARAGWFRGALAAKHILVNPPVIRVDGDQASALSDTAWLAVLGDPADGGVQIKAIGRLDDRLRRVEGAWVIARRRIIAQIPGPVVPPENLAAAGAALREASQHISR